MRVLITSPFQLCIERRKREDKNGSAVYPIYYKGNQYGKNA